MWLSPPIPHPCGPQSSFLWVPLCKWRWIWDIPDLTTGLGSGCVCRQWDEILHPQAVCWKTPGDAGHCFLIHLTLPKAPGAQRGKLRQSR